ncbi:MerR family transcriptional regulator [Variovorax terrae]|uniref:MerR family transcriptional regulator n=1 Tax=Variovorax terrae TaxID=2923278 RepID=A0A9X2AM16_9BURK|nr:MerR family transcriptional regulator [Variovorax terrae]MCJ0762829.1 MerR family transcriptional regulator [Variovorax terrae]
MKIGELASKTGMTASAIRFYEQSGLLPAAERGGNGYRSYGNAAVERLRLIQIAQAMGFSLDALRSVFASTEGFSKDELLGRLGTRLGEIDKVMATLRGQRRALQELQETLRASWAAGECVDATALAAGMADRSARPTPSRAGARRLAERSAALRQARPVSRPRGSA